MKVIDLFMKTYFKLHANVSKQDKTSLQQATEETEAAF